MLKILCWTLPASIAICGASYSCALYNVEEVKQTAFMMKVCTDAGGMWGGNWGPAYCQRAK